MFTLRFPFSRMHHETPEPPLPRVFRPRQRNYVCPCCGLPLKSPSTGPQPSSRTKVRREKRYVEYPFPITT